MHELIVFFHWQENDANFRYRTIYEKNMLKEREFVLLI